jgi:precorrin-6B methylase 2
LLLFTGMQLIDIFIFLAILLVLGIVVMAVSAIFLKAPYVPTPIKVAKKMVTLANLEDSEVIYDLGAGDGRLLIEVVKMHPGIKAFGSELSPLVCYWGKLKIWLSGKRNAHLKMKNLFTEDLRDADCIFLYLMPGIMEKLLDKFAEELRPGTKIVSYAFPLQGLTPIQTEEVPWIQGKKKILLYEWQ